MSPKYATGVCPLTAGHNYAWAKHHPPLLCTSNSRFQRFEFFKSLTKSTLVHPWLCPAVRGQIFELFWSHFSLSILETHKMWTFWHVFNEVNTGKNRKNHENCRKSQITPSRFGHIFSDFFDSNRSNTIPSGHKGTIHDRKVKKSINFQIDQFPQTPLGLTVKI